MGDQIKVLQEIIDEVRKEQKKYEVVTAEWKACNDALLRLNSALQDAQEAELRSEEKRVKMEIDQDNQINEVKKLEISEANRDEDLEWEKKKFLMEFEAAQSNEAKKLEIAEANRNEDRKWEKRKFWIELGVTLLGVGINIIPVLLCFRKEDKLGEIVTGKKVNFLPKVLFTRFRFLK